MVGCDKCTGALPIFLWAADRVHRGSSFRCLVSIKELFLFTILGAGHLYCQYYVLGINQEALNWRNKIYRYFNLLLLTISTYIVCKRICIKLYCTEAVFLIVKMCLELVTKPNFVWLKTGFLNIFLKVLNMFEASKITVLHLFSSCRDCLCEVVTDDMSPELAHMLCPLCPNLDVCEAENQV